MTATPTSLPIAAGELTPLIGGDPRMLITAAREHERLGRTAEALRVFGAAVRAAEATADSPMLAEALRRLATLHRRRRELDAAEALCRRSHDVAVSMRSSVLAAEALNGLALVYLERGEFDTARRHLRDALSAGAEHQELRARIEQNLGILANIRGDFREALHHYQASLEAFQAARDQRGCAIAYHNLGMVSADRRAWEDADRYFAATLEIADTTGDIRMRGLALLNRSEVLIARQRFEEARQSVDEALRIFDELGEQASKAIAYKYLGVLYREIGQPALAEARLRDAVDLASRIGGALGEAEASRELAVLYQSLNRNQEALRYLNASYRLFNRLDARADLVDVGAKVADLESVYLRIVSEWGRSIESTDAYTFGHSERVATYAARLGRALGLDDAEVTTLRIGAYLHDLGKVRVPHEILTKPGRLTREEFEVMQLHPVHGIDLLASIEFPWDIRPIIRWHHEKVDGSGYPDRLRGDEIPFAAQLICAVDVYDALTTTRSYRAAMPAADAIAEMMRCRHWWRPDVIEGFLEMMG